MALSTVSKLPACGLCIYLSDQKTYPPVSHIVRLIHSCLLALHVRRPRPPLVVQLPSADGSSLPTNRPGYIIHYPRRTTPFSVWPHATNTSTVRVRAMTFSYVLDPSYYHDDADPSKVWDKTTFTLKTTLKGHTASVLALEYAPDKRWLFSASGW